MKLSSKKFVASYSGGKDSVLAIYRALQQGLTPIAFIITYNTDRERSWFHGIPQSVLKNIEQSLDIPIWLIKTSGAEYAKSFEKALLRAKEHGAEACVFGDIDIEDHRKWCSDRCQAAGIEPLFPLWGEERKKLVYEFIDNGFMAHFSVIDTERMSVEFLEQRLTRATVDKLALQGVDICGENGEYHTFVSAGPLFRQPVQFSFGEKKMEGSYAVLEIEGFSK